MRRLGAEPVKGLFRFGGVVVVSGWGRSADDVLGHGMGWGGVGWGVWCAGWALTTLLNGLLYTSGAFSRRLTGVVNAEVALQTAKWRSRRSRSRAPELSAARCSQAWRSGVVSRRRGGSTRVLEHSARPAARTPVPGRRRPRRPEHARVGPRTSSAPRARPRRPENVLVRPTTTCAGRARPRKPETLPNVEGLGMTRTFSTNQHPPSTTTPARTRPRRPDIDLIRPRERPRERPRQAHTDLTTPTTTTANTATRTKATTPQPPHPQTGRA